MLMNNNAELCDTSFTPAPVKLPARPRGASVAKPSETPPKPPAFAHWVTSRSPHAIPPRAPARGILAKASEVPRLKRRGFKLTFFIRPGKMKFKPKFRHSGEGRNPGRNHYYKNLWIPRSLAQTWH